ncbi:profilin-like [Amphibalanus amphitrite]|uniref:profilin-like n=1 Tax=Amphibalanus amphitrite TaxID=1232801 RepID=UPI001C901574|nr:profilin-like [Amphibalanus amphitrite]XP_043246862.1 profilin-like [Amphibalanus amphitrite]
MSWQDYVNKQLLATGSLRDALIMGMDGVIWARSTGLQETKPEEVQNLLASLSDGGATLEDVGGIRVAGTRYLYLAGEPGVFLSCKRAAVGLYVRQTQRVAIVALYQDPATLQQCEACVTSLCHYLGNKGF